VKRYGSFGTLILFLALTAVSAFAQETPATQAESKHRFEITPYGGVVWTSGYDVLLGGQKGNLDTRTTAVWGMTVGYSLRDSLTQIELIFSHQNADIYFEFSGQEIDYTGVSVDHLQLGALLGTPRGKTVWFTAFSLGTSHWAPKGEGDDAWRFSFMLGLGAKYPVNDRFGLRLQARFPYMIVQDSSKFVCGPSGCLTSGGGSGMWQFDLSLGLIIKL
jgi:opacity protein-like surface antigen